ncbi:MULTISPECIES: glycosyltransferase [Sphingomonas]|uniref:Uncharacterized protein n=2 Tax=Sphingomonas adhaesiva TaxID=28212 RepID=A0A2A4IA92_9SPHN|nr:MULTISPECIES: glycosyltransferase [Sphingomonas]PCG14730.1 hypothetical protein COA07_09620 [Sphingomonas adhaesiva]PZU81645.1 MAG: hypothetical protein DI530_00785 [Sphingomonas sp.]
MSARHRLLVVGGSSDHPGGVEAFCDRGTAALAAHTDRWTVDRIAADSAYLSRATLRRYLRQLGRLVSHCRRGRPDLVWVQYVNLPDLGFVLLARAMGRRVMVTPHLGSNWRSQSHPLLRRLSQWALARAQRLALISRTQELEIALPPALPRSLIRNFLPQSVLSSVPAAGDTMPDRLQLIHSSRLSEGKGTFLVVETCALLRDRGVPFDARITGGADAETMARLHALIAERGLEDQVKVLGRIPEDELLDLLGRSDVLIHLSKIDSYPLIVLEAMACSTVPLVMELAGARDMVETYRGHVVSAATPVAEAAAWLQSLDVPTLRRERPAVAAPVRADYAWSRAAGALEAALDATVASLPGAPPARALPDDAAARS